MASGKNEDKPEYVTNDWQIEWLTATPQNLGSLQSVTDEEGIRRVEEAVNRCFRDGFKSEEYKFWYFYSEGNTFIKVIVSNRKPNYDMILTGELPALGMVMFRAEDTDFGNIWKDLACQIEEKAKQIALTSAG
ncbi:uncharacterized protein FOMMEDRAFT_152713 [Fomitiporia mediterranea MF3/22]|uniref:uncharacterized protein n=1 Tax=Fomitiporia mediterranea (strain MF3/22) TaxID=694068 RepID=UPI0004409B83|nr:uncharacterized protein FOMMEDRAFT_152713 [Fomitiporia mediterranea MF3/22]EJD05409.1 hypothetical protein FOMMEDRAFT_152713 [Fomitiporia mediterranea MF3/22]